MKKSPPYWYCDERKMFTAPHTWNKADSHFPLGKHLVLVTTNAYKGLVLRAPSRFDRVKSLFKRLGVVWWSYLPEPPSEIWPKIGPKTCDDVLLHCQWAIDPSAAPKKA